MEKIDPSIVIYTSKIALLPFENYKTRKELEAAEENSIEKAKSSASLFVGLPAGFIKVTLEALTKYILEPKIQQYIESKPLQKMVSNIVSTLISYPFDVSRKRKVKNESFEDPKHVKPLEKKYFKGLSYKLIFNSLSVGMAEYSSEKFKILENETLNKGLIWGFSRLMLYPLEIIATRFSTSFETSLGPVILNSSDKSSKTKGIMELYKSSWTSVLETIYSTIVEYSLNK